MLDIPGKEPTEARVKKERPKLEKGIVDCDFHPYFKNGLRDLIPYMTESWARKLGFGGDKAWAGNFAASQFVLPLDYLYINVAGATRSDASQNGEIPASDPAFTAKQLFEDHGISRAVMIAGHLFGIGSFPDPDVSATVASAYNRWQQEQWLEYHKGFRGAIVVPPQNPEAAVKEINDMGDKPGVVAIFMPLHDIAMGERHYYPIYEAAQRKGLPIITHPSGTESVFARAPRMAAQPTYYLEWHTMLGQIHQSNMCSLICHGVFERFPELKVVVAEGGFMWAIETILKLDRDWQALRDEVPWLKKWPSEYMRKNMRFTTQPLPETRKKEHLTAVLDMVYAEETLVYSSDYPHWDFDDPQRALLSIEPGLRKKIQIDNGWALFGDRLA